MMFLVKDQGGGDTLRFLEKILEKMVSHQKSIEKLIFITSKLK